MLQNLSAQLRMEVFIHIQADVLCCLTHERFKGFMTVQTDRAELKESVK